MSDDEPTPHFDSPEQEIRHWKSKVDDMRDALRDAQATLSEFMESSKELEVEMEREISASTKTITDLQRNNDALKDSVEEWKLKYQKSHNDYDLIVATSTKELTSLRESHKLYKSKLRDMEMDNDELENAERMIASSLADMENRYNKSIERMALMEEELAQKSDLQEENQRLKDELRELEEELAVTRNNRVYSRATSRADTIPEDTNANNSSDEVGLAEAGPSTDRRKERPLSYTAERPSSRQTGPSPSLGRPAFSPRITSNQAHARRGSRDVRDLIATASISESPDSMVRSKSAKILGTAARESLAAGSPNGRSSLRNTVRPLPRTPTTRAKSGGTSMLMVQNMVAKMKTLEGRISSARNLSSVAAVESSIPRPSSRLGSVGPGGYSSPTHVQSARRQGPRPSLEGKASTMSSIPLPSSGLSRPNTARRPNSRLSNRGTPPLPNVGLPRSATPSSQLSTPYTLSSRGPSPLEFMDHDPAMKFPQNARLNAAAVARRRNSVATAMAAGGTPAKVRGGSSIPLLGTPAAVRRDGGARTSSIVQRHESGQMSKDAGPPTSWRASTHRPRSGSFSGKAPI